MATPRKSQISLDDTPYYHCISRCVRRAFLCGEDQFSGRSYEHRRQWIVDRIKELSSIFAIKTCAYAVLSNHTHTVLYVSREKALSWTAQEVTDRWYKLYGGNVLVNRFVTGEAKTAAEHKAATQQIEIWRTRLYDISWYMRSLNEHIARKANHEDGCTGRFWEGRFKSQALLDDAALLTCMSYVDLNPVRAGMATTPEESDYTSIQERIRAIKLTCQTDQTTANTLIPTPTGLMPFVGGEHIEKEQGVPFYITDYLQLTDWTGMAIRNEASAPCSRPLPTIHVGNKSGAIPSDIAPILERLNIAPEAWLDNIRHYGTLYSRAVGAKENIARYCEGLNQSWICGVRAAQQLYKPIPI
ncbi:Transposase and inactivated derivatives [hydrothermal vent metagenome]|uniref:Transposase and inactivated derivatives n=1 Tax=hydrothermal vent metagenome TaxID=652676 RepID=A0A3B1ANB3_9ZZZZ